MSGSETRFEIVHGDALDWLRDRAANSVHAVVTDPPYGLVEYSSTELAKVRNGGGGIWRLPHSYNGHNRKPLPRFTVLSDEALRQIDAYFNGFAMALKRVLVPGAHVFVASNPLVAHLVTSGFTRAGFDMRGVVVRLVQTLKGGDRPKNAHLEFASVSVLPRSVWEPWLLFRRPIEGRVQDNLRKWGTGGLRRLEDGRPFKDLIPSSPASRAERLIADHPSLKPQHFLRQIVRASLPLGRGVVLDPFAGSGSTLAAAQAVGYQSIGVEKDTAYYELAVRAVPLLAKVEPKKPVVSLGLREAKEAVGRRGKSR
jgi:site-specific DNA-methyltransferase (adenine-specific)